MRPLTFQQARGAYVHRYTLEHVPEWAAKPAPNGRYYAPQYASDKEWYDNTLFKDESDLADRNHCYSSGQTWPLGEWLDQPLRREAA